MDNDGDIKDDNAMKGRTAKYPHAVLLYRREERGGHCGEFCGRVLPGVACGHQSSDHFLSLIIMRTFRPHIHTGCTSKWWSKSPPTVIHLMA